MSNLIERLRVKIFADGADKISILRLAREPYIQGFTTNPTLMRKAGVIDYERFARGVIEAIPDRPISFEVLSDDFKEMEAQALLIASWGPNVYVKIPVMNTRGVSAAPLIGRLSHRGVKVNVTAVMTLDQVERVVPYLEDAAPAYLSIFAGRIADTGRDPLPLMKTALALIRPFPHLELLWASPREVFNASQANEIGCHIITMTPELLKKLSLFGHDLEEFSRQTVVMFNDDAQAAGYSLDVII